MTKAFFQSPFVLQPSRIDSRWDNIQLNVVSDFRYVEGYPFTLPSKTKYLSNSTYYSSQGGGGNQHTHTEKKIQNYNKIIT